jgi:tetratricopeptide (TPR) repeat protein
MANIRRLMAEARRLEESGDLQKAIVLHRQALAVQEETTGFADLSLYNGLGDLYLRAGELRKAVEAFEEAAQHCEDQQLYSNGIAVCKKILRNAPDCVGAYRREGRLLALSGLEAQSLASYRTYLEHMKREGRTNETIEALSEFVDLTAHDETALELAERMVEVDRGLEALTRLRAVRDRREEQGRDVVALVRRIQELQPRYGTPAQGATGQKTPSAHPRSTSGSGSPPPSAETGSEVSYAAPETPKAEERVPSSASSPGHAEPTVGRVQAGTTPGTANVEADPPAASGGAAEPVAKTDDQVSASSHPHDSDSDVTALMHELQDVLSRLDGEQKFRHALPIVEHLLEFEPDRFELLHRKLGYAYALGEEAATIAAYLALGECLDRHLSSFSIRALSTSTPDGDVKAALKVEEFPEVAPTS